MAESTTALGARSPVAGTDATPRPRLLAGIGAGLMASSIAALYTVMARYGIARGLTSPDITFLRFLVAGLLMLPVLALRLRGRAQRRAFGAQWPSWLAVAAFAGPLFGLLMFGAFQFAPASHAAVFPFATMSVMGTVLAAFWLADPLTARKLVGIAVVVAGLVVLSGLDAASISGRALTGDAMFILAGVLWAGFGIVLRRSRLDPMMATAVIAFVALLTYVPGYLLLVGGARLWSTPAWLLVLEGVVQGAMAGIGSLYFYAKAVQLLGAARTAVFPALAPGFAALMAWPILGHLPTHGEAVGLCIAVVGLLITSTRGRARA